MSITIWKKRLTILKQKLYRYPEPEPMPHDRSFWLAMGLVAVAFLIFSAVFITFMVNGQNNFMTNAEDMGIMDQAVWSTVHGHVLHQTICDILGDTNCYDANGVMRFAIHFEPILFPISLTYLFWPDARTLLVLQTLVVATGAFPAFWLARLRLRNNLVAVGFAIVYLLYPAQEAAITFDFHAVTLTAAFLLFMIYFMYTRRTVWLFVFAILAMSCKEEIPLVVACFGIWSILFQQRVRSGLALTLLAGLWAILGLFLVPHIFSPTGHELLVSRYTYLGGGPLHTAKVLLLHPVYDVKQFLVEHSRRVYLEALFGSAGYLPLLAPWLLPITIPTLAINLISSLWTMHYNLDFNQYTAELAPTFLFASIEATVLILWIARRLLARNPRAEEHPIINLGKNKTAVRLPSLAQVVYVGLLVFITGYAITSATYGDFLQTTTPFHNVQLQSISPAHSALAQRFINQLPADASVSAQSKLVPHVSHRVSIYLFPYGDGITTPAFAQYIFLDKTSDFYPYPTFNLYSTEVQKVLKSPTYHILDQDDGYILLKCNT